MVCLCVCVCLLVMFVNHTKRAEPVGRLRQMSLMNYVLDGGSDTQGEGTLLGGCLDYWKASGAFAAVCAKTAEPIEMPFGGLGD